MNSKKYDFLIVGAGIVGLTVARELTERYPAAKIAILEKEKKIGMHASGRNSGVLHSGIYYPQDSLKSKVCAEGARRMRAFAKEHGIRCEKTGKVIIATCTEEIPVVDRLLQNGKDNHIEAHKLDEKEIRKIEPHANVHEYGLYTPDTASIDSAHVLQKMDEIIRSRGVEIFYQQAVIAGNAKQKTVSTQQQTYHYGYLFNCAGAGTDKVAKLLGKAKDYSLLPFKGIYYKLKPEKNHLVNGNIYPVPDLKLPFLGVHFTRTMSGDVYVGPTAIPAFGRENYGLIKGIDGEAFRIVKDLMLMYVANQQHFRLLMYAEIKKYLKYYFVSASQKLVKSVTAADLISSNKVGIRPQLINLAKRKIEMDYIIEQDENAMHVLNAISPAFTGSLAFAELLVNKMDPVQEYDKAALI